jgi:preprotein translocase subunit SecG
MRIKTIIIIIVAIILTVVLMQNKGPIDFQFLWITMSMSKLILFALIAFIGFILGLLFGRSKKNQHFNGDHAESDFDRPTPGTLSDEDRNYLN